MLSYVCAPESLRAFSRPALIAGHPGHELKLFGWLSECRPRLYVITDGSGRRGVSRAPASAALAERLGLQQDKIFGCISDSNIYQAMLERDSAFFLGLAEELAASLVENRIDLVAGDAAEGYNPTHDLCRVVIDAAVLMAERTTGLSIANYEICLTEWEEGFQEQHDERCAHLRLDDRLLRQKLEAAENYGGLREEVDRAIARRGKEYFRTECLRKVSYPFALRRGAIKPMYERWGERRVADGKYDHVIRFEEHILPITEVIADHAAQAEMAGISSAKSAS